MTKNLFARAIIAIALGLTLHACGPVYRQPNGQFTNPLFGGGFAGGFGGGAFSASAIPTRQPPSAGGWDQANTSHDPATHPGIAAQGPTYVMIGGGAGGTMAGNTGVVTPAPVITTSGSDRDDAQDRAIRAIVRRLTRGSQ